MRQQKQWTLSVRQTNTIESKRKKLIKTVETLRETTKTVELSVR